MLPLAVTRFANDRGGPMKFRYSVLTLILGLIFLGSSEGSLGASQLGVWHCDNVRGFEHELAGGKVNYASTHNVSGSDWTYICCTVRHGSSCYEKIK